MKVFLTSRDRKQLNRPLVRWGATCHLRCPSQDWMIVHWRYCRLAVPIGSRELCVSTSLCYLKLNEFKIQVLNHSSGTSSANSNSHEWPAATLLDIRGTFIITESPMAKAWKGMFCAVFLNLVLEKGRSRKHGAGNRRNWDEWYEAHLPLSPGFQPHAQPQAKHCSGGSVSPAVQLQLAPEGGCECKGTKFSSASGTNQDAQMLGAML